MHVLGLIPARGGSKGIPSKNIKPFAGRPLIAWTIDAALNSTRLADVVVSTNDATIGEVARRYGAKTPFVRPEELARDDTPGVEPALHALTMLPEFDAVMLLQPTSPLRRAEDIDACIRFAEASDAPCAVSVCSAPRHPYWMYTLDASQRLNPLIRDKLGNVHRQELPPVYTVNGALYFARAAWLRQTRSFIAPDTVGYVMPTERSIDLDTLLDWNIAELLLQGNQ